MPRTEASQLSKSNLLIPFFLLRSSSAASIDPSSTRTLWLYNVNLLNYRLSADLCKARFAIIYNLLEMLVGKSFDGYELHIKHQTPSLASCATAG